jgi:hypothetical protein
MMTEEQQAKVTALKEAIAATAATSGGASREVRQRVVGLKKELRQGGTTARALAAALGLHETTLCRWEREAQASGGRAERTGLAASGFRRVQVAAPEPRPVAAAQAPVSSGLRVAHGPSGLIIDGLDIEALATLVRRLS